MHGSFITRNSTRSDPRPLACVIGEIDLVRALALAGVRSAVVAPPGAITRYSRFTTAVIDWIDPWMQPEALVERLVRFGSSQAQTPVLFYDGDWDLLVVSRFRKALGTAFRFVVPDGQLVEDLVDKARFQALAERLALPVPLGRRLSPVDGSTPSDIDLRFPLVVKPLTRQHETWKDLSPAKAIHIRDSAGLRELWPRLVDASVDAFFQEVVPGPESAIESYHVYRDAEGDIVGEFTGRKIRTYPRAYGYSTALEISDSGEVASIGRETTERLALQGVAKLDFKRGPDGHLYLLEVNPRFNLWHHPGAKAGVNLPALVYADLTGRPRPAIGPVRSGVRWCSLANDARAARESGVPLARWIAWALTCEAMSPLAWNDPLPAVRGGFDRLAARLKARVSRPRQAR
jgi:D-aspartate ligase